MDGWMDGKAGRRKTGKKTEKNMHKKQTSKEILA